MGGAIGVESEVGVGSVFWFELNATTEPYPESVVAEPAPTPTPLAFPVDARRHKVLYVEDNPANLRLVERLMAGRPDIQLLIAVDGVAGIEIARTELPEVILMDINLPGINGIHALRILAEDNTTAHIPVIALSANAMPRDIAKGLSAGFFKYLTKPIKVEQLMNTLDAALDFASVSLLALNENQEATL
jgi:CheY-like chemotaxis protein